MVVMIGSREVKEDVEAKRRRKEVWKEKEKMEEKKVE